MTLVDANYKFFVVDVGSYGKKSDDGIFDNLSFGKYLENTLIDYSTQIIFRCSGF